MVTRKDLVFVVLATFCLTATLFVVIPTRSSPNGYDPWLDVNEDGTINILDISAMAKAFMSTGDPTKNVTVTSFPTYEWQYLGIINFTNSGGGSSMPRIYCGGYSKMVITMVPLSITDWSQNYSITFSLTQLHWHGLDPNVGMFEYYNSPGIQNITVEVQPYVYPQRPPWQFESANPTLIDIKAPYCTPSWGWTVSSDAPASWWAMFDVYAYLRNE